jgi:hypothetical protein
MAIGFRVSAHVTSGGSQAASQPFALPGTVQLNDVVLILGVQVTLIGAPSALTASSTGTAPVRVGPVQTATNGAIPATLNAAVWSVSASALDAGQTVTLGSADPGFWSAGLGVWTGASTAGPVDVTGGATALAAGTVTCPVKVTTADNDWLVVLGGGAAEAGGWAVPAGLAARESDATSAASVCTGICDGNASAGLAGSNIGGQAFTCTANANNILAGFTVGLRPAGLAAAGPPPGGGSSMLRRSLWAADL